MKIGQLAKAVGCTVETIRFYEKQGLLSHAERTNGNFRVYNNAHLQQLSFICYCRTLDISLNEIKMLINLDKAPKNQSKEINELLDRHIKDVAKRIHELDHLRQQLIRLKGKFKDSDGADNLMKTLLQHSGSFVKI
ncbi:Cd(II)/Pb(II)-responsive transcriptional regulator [Cricetibacter osteomyelitidis]|uniref:Cd(II)/Pb(II)-responsive transcriptional regulator n=1 Tax=Cricetibacter osteomyelitidis TaxID=1521931 RepID=A0A4R2TRP9_9PAST|nr:Cd(II)/Pb(II)-responsive transcriptional regulator [Cricetibacter osteomyelitidis]TCP97712.1 Cd(II)/Pb(II)-responsive transcriptional regulator [Cricetibacter osteomyelitidis]